MYIPGVGSRVAALSHLKEKHKNQPDLFDFLKVEDKGAGDNEPSDRACAAGAGAGAGASAASAGGFLVIAVLSHSIVPAVMAAGMGLYGAFSAARQNSRPS